MKKLISLTAVAAVLISPLAMAQSRDLEQGAYLGAALGSSKYSNLGGSDSVTGGKLLFGYAFHPNFAIEGGYIDFGKASFNVGPISGTARSKGANVSLVARAPLSDPLSIYGKVGYFSGNSDSNSVNVRRKDNDTTFGAGMTYMFNRTVGASLDWDRLGRDDSVDMVSAGVVVRFR